MFTLSQWATGRFLMDLLGKHCIMLDTGLRGLAVGVQSYLGRTDRYVVRFIEGGNSREEWFSVLDLEFL